MVDTTFIYALNDPETGECRYIGKSDSPTARFSHHMSVFSPACHKTNWIKALTKRGLKPLLEILDEVPKSQWQFWEKKYIFVSRALGMDLVNSNSGGNGCVRHTTEERAKISAGNSGRSKPLGYGEKMRKILTGRKRPPEICAKLRIKLPGASSRFHGVGWTAQFKNWTARIHVNNKSIFLGRFFDELDAARAYDVAAKKYHGEFAKLNFPSE